MPPTPAKHVANIIWSAIKSVNRAHAELEQASHHLYACASTGGNGHSPTWTLSIRGLFRDQCDQTINTLGCLVMDPSVGVMIIESLHQVKHDLGFQ